MAAFDDLLADQDAKRIYLVHLVPHDMTVPSGTKDFYFSANAEVATYNGKLWRARLVPPAFTVGINAGDDFLADSNTQFGNLVLANGDGELDELCELRWDDAAVTVYMGGEDFAWADFGTIFTGVAREATWDDDTIGIHLRDYDERFNENIQSDAGSRYLGTGGYEGGKDLEGKPKPLCYGRCKNVSPINIDDPDSTGNSLVYQVHDGQIAEISAVYDMMFAYTGDGDTADLYAWTPVPGHFKTDLSRGLFRVGNRPMGGLITADVRGDNAVSYVENLNDVAERILLTKGGLTSGNLDAASFAALDTWANYSVGVYIDTDTDIKSVLDYVLGSGGVGRYWASDGTLHVKQLRFFASQGTITDKDVVSIRRVETELPVWERILGYERNYTPMGEDDITEDVPDALKAFALKDWRSLWRKNVLFKSQHRPLAQSLRTDTALCDKTHAALECDRQLELFGATTWPYNHRDRYDVTLRRHQMLYNPYETITVDYDRFGLSGGRQFIILGLSEDLASGATELRLWG